MLINSSHLKMNSQIFFVHLRFTAQLSFVAASLFISRTAACAVHCAVCSALVRIVEKLELERGVGIVHAILSTFSGTANTSFSVPAYLVRDVSKYRYGDKTQNGVHSCQLNSIFNFQPIFTY